MSRRMIDSKAKGYLYSFLSALFLDGPSEDQTERLQEVLKILKLPPAGTWSLGELKKEYYDLFVVPNPRYVRPYESVYRDRIPVEFTRSPELGKPPMTRYIKGLLMGKSARSVAAFYKAAGICPERELPDHIGNEFAFLGYLAGQEGETSGRCAKKFAKMGEDFKKRHLLKWIGKLEKKVAQKDSTGYYRNALSVGNIILLQ